jgi:DNA-binding NarL/FixJ family response regulator
MHAEVVYVRRALEAGALGYLSKGASAEELVAAIQKVYAGKRYVEEEIAKQLAVKHVCGIPDSLEKLTARELEILRLLGEGCSLSAIADAFGVAYKTIANTCSTMKTKLAVERTADLIRLALQMRG